MWPFIMEEKLLYYSLQSLHSVRTFVLFRLNYRLLADTIFIQNNFFKMKKLIIKHWLVLFQLFKYSKSDSKLIQHKKPRSPNSTQPYSAIL